MEGSAVSPPSGGSGVGGGGGVTLRSKVERQKAGVQGEEGRRRSVDPAFTVSGCHLFTHSTVRIGPDTLSDERRLHNVSSPRLTFRKTSRFLTSVQWHQFMCLLQVLQYLLPPKYNRDEWDSVC